jgi:hypothetical protein
LLLVEISSNRPGSLKQAQTRDRVCELLCLEAEGFLVAARGGREKPKAQSILL